LTTQIGRPVRVPESSDDDGTGSIAAAERLLRAGLGPRHRTARVIDAATRRAHSLAALGAGELGPDALLSEILPELCRDRDLDHEKLRALVDRTAELTGTPSDVFKLRVAQSAITGRTLLKLRADQAVDRAMMLLLVLVPARQLSLWQADEEGAPKCSSHAGPFPSKRTATLASHVLKGSSPGHSTGLLVGVTMRPGEHPPVAIMARPEAGARARCDTLLREIAPLMAGLLERRWLSDQAVRTERILTEASERRLSRLAFDLHDGALQNVAGVTGDLAMLRRRLQTILPDQKQRRQVLGCVDDLDARLHAIDSELRDLCHSLESPVVPRASFARLIEEEMRAFARRTDIRPGLEIEGDFDDLTESQRIALWRIIQESLSNAREHSSAREVRVSAVATDDVLQVDVTDDGCGFGVAETLLDAAKRGRLGLVGVSERVRLLGGTCEIRSAPGGPTTVSVILPRWRPETET
jgi:signal transduction histidine kinase